MTLEPEYTDVYEDGGEIRTHRPSVQKWKIPRNEFERRILASCKRKYFADRGEVYDTHKIHKAMISLKRDGVLSIYPTEWVESCIAFAERQNRLRIQVLFPNLLKYINNEEKKTDWIADFMRREAIDLKPSDELEDFTDYGTE